MEIPTSVKGFAAMRAGAGVLAIAAPSVLARLFGLPPADARSPLAASASAFFGIRELGLAGLTVGASSREPVALRRLLVVNAATDALDLLVLGLRAIRQPGLRRGVLLFGPAAVLSVVLHLQAAQKVEILP